MTTAEEAGYQRRRLKKLGGEPIPPVDPGNPSEYGIRPYRYWIEGEGVAEAADVALRSALEQLKPLLAEAGFHLHQQPVFDARVQPKRRRWAVRMVSLEEVAAAVVEHPGADAEAYAEALYATSEPWTRPAFLRAVARFRGSVRRMRAERPGWVVEDQDVKTGRRTYRPGPSAPKPARPVSAEWVP